MGKGSRLRQVNKPVYDKHFDDLDWRNNEHPRDVVVLDRDAATCEETPRQRRGIAREGA